VIFYIPFRLIFWTKFENKKEFRRLRKMHKGFIVCSNHRNNLDSIVMYFRLPRKTHFAAKGSLFKGKFWSWFFRSAGAFPVDRGKDLSLIKNCVGILKKDRLLLLFPEGGRNFAPEDALALRNGAAMIALKAGVPLMPLVTDREPRAFRLTRFRYGTPIFVDEYLDKKMSKDDLNEISTKLSTQMSGMLVGYEKPEKRKSWDEEPINNVRGVCVIVEDDVSKVVLLKRNKGDGEYYVFPGGHVDEGEKPRDAAVREMEEETGLKTVVKRCIYKYELPEELRTNGVRLQGYYVLEAPNGSKLAEKPEGIEYQEPNEERGTYQPVLISASELPNLDIRPTQIRDQLILDLPKNNGRLIRQTLLIE